MANKNITILIGALVFVAFGYFLYISMSKPQVSTNTQPLESTESMISNATVTYNGISFTPTTVTIKQGDTVKFVNNSNSDMWVASATHPTHEKYPEFDANAGIVPGDSYQFKFENIGEWPFHDHLNPTIFGKVVVQ